jgi:putative SOS response-associated peptidase YedK
VVVERRDNSRAVVGYRWGLVPSWTDRDARAPTRMFNARSESVAAKPAFRGLLAKHRLLVPVDGFYEWRRGPDLARQPYYIHRLDGRPLALAGLWATWHDPVAPRGADPLRSATILTTVPNALLCQVHSRMPVVLSELHWDNWLDPNLTDPTSLLAACTKRGWRSLPSAGRAQRERSRPIHAIGRRSADPADLRLVSSCGRYLRLRIADDNRRNGHPGLRRGCPDHVHAPRGEFVGLGRRDATEEDGDH